VISARRAGVRLAVGFGLLLAAVAGAQPAALLVTGPEVRTGLTAVGPNVASSHRAECQYGRERVIFSHTAAPQPVPNGWISVVCDGWQAFVSAPSSPFDALIVGPKPQFQVVFEFPASALAEPTAWCPFATRFLDRFICFQGFIQHESDIAFPAVIEL